MGYPPVLEQEGLGLASFVPMKLAARVMTRHGQHQERRFEGAALFADISGYVRITEELCGAGKRGLEQLSTLLDASFVHYLDVIAAHAGEVVCFAGDGLVVCWDAEESGTASAARAALACANELCHAQDAYPAHANPTLHIGVAVGPLWSARVGGFEGHWELLLGGDAVRAAARAQALGKRNEVIATDRVVELAAAGLELEERAVGYSVVRAFAPRHSTPVPAHAHETRAALSASDIRELVPTAVREFYAAGARSWSAELRRISALFVRVEGLDERLENALERFQKAARALQQAVRRFSDSTGQLIIDDKGLVFLVTLGTPHNAHVDDAIRAANAALALREQLHALDLGASIGLATGVAFCGVLGSGHRRAYATVGRPMNLAARMMSQAHGAVLCADAQAEQQHDGLSWIAAGEFLAKGLERPIAMYRLERSDHASRAARLFGRTAEHIELHARLEALIGGQAGLCIVTGEAGMGKSCLMRELLASARQRSVTTTVVRADSAQTAAYAAFRNVFEAIFGIDANTDRAQAQARVLAKLALTPQLQRLQPLAPLLSSVLPIELEDTAPTRFLAGQARADATLRMLVDCIDELAPRPLLLVIEDAQWLDSASWRLVASLTQRVQHVLLALATRPMRLDAEIEALLAAKVTALELQPLGAADAADLIEHALEAPVHAEVARAIYQHTKGHPLFAQEYTRLLREIGRLVPSADGFRFATAAGLNDVAPPATVQAVITSRLDHLPEAERLVVKVASVLGHEFDQDLLTAVYPLQGERTQIADALENLCTRGLLERANKQARAFAFHHAIIRDVAYDLMLEHQRSALHRAVADVVEGRAYDQVTRDDALLAHHWRLAGDRDKTLHYSDLATMSALDNGAYREAVGLLDTCVALTEVPRVGPDLVRRRRQLADAYAGLGDLAACEDAARKALALAGTKGAAAAPVRGLIAAATIALSLAQQRVGAHAPLPQVERGLDLDLSKAHSHLAEVLYYRGDALGLAAEQLCAIQCALQHGKSGALARAIAQLGGSLTLAGAHVLSRRALDLAIEISSAVDEPLALAYCHMVHALCAVGRGEWDQVATSVRISQEICEAVHNVTQWCNGQMVAFWASHYRGETEKSGEAAQLLRERALSNHNAQQAAWGERALAVFELQRGAPERALAHAERAVASISGDHANEIVAAWGTCALARLRSADLDGAQQAIDRALQTGTARKRQTSHGNLAGWSGIAEVALQLCERSQREHSGLVDHVLAGLQQYRRSFRIGEPSYCYFRGLSEAQRGNALYARGFFLRGFLAAERIGARLERDRLAAQLGR